MTIDVLDHENVECIVSDEGVTVIRLTGMTWEVMIDLLQWNQWSDDGAHSSRQCGK